MAWLEDAFEGENLLTTAAIGIGAVVLLPLIRPVLKLAVKGGIVVYDWAGRMSAEARQDLQEAAAAARAAAPEVKPGDIPRTSPRGRPPGSAPA